MVEKFNLGKVSYYKLDITLILFWTPGLCDILVKDRNGLCADKLPVKIFRYWLRENIPTSLGNRIYSTQNMKILFGEGGRSLGGPLP